MIGSADKNLPLKRKLEDMAVAYKAFLNYINNNYITSEEVITVFSGDCKYVRNYKGKCYIS